MIKVLLWDVDGTLLNFRESEKYSIRKCFSLFGLGDCPDAMLTRYSAINKKYWESLERGEITKREVLHDRFVEFFEKENIVFREVDAFNNEYQMSLGDRVFFNDDSYELVRDLKPFVKQYAVTNGTLVAQERKLARSGFDRLLDGVFISEQLGVEKPNPSFFDAVREKIGSFRNEEVMIVGDSLTSDMRGGFNSGIVCCWYNPYGNENHSGLDPRYEIKNLQQLREILGVGC